MGAFGVPFFAAGVLMILTVLGVIPIGNADGMPRYGWPILALMGVAFTTPS